MIVVLAASICIFWANHFLIKALGSGSGIGHTIVVNVSFASKEVRILLVCFPTIDMLIQVDD